PKRPTGALQVRLLRRAEAKWTADMADVHRSLRSLRRPEDPLARQRLQGARRLVLGVATLAADAPDARDCAVPPRAGRLRAPCLPLVGAAPRASGVAELDVRRQVAGA